MPRFGTSTPCPGCSQSVSPMERGVVPGPHGQRWHSSCLVCGGRQAKGRGGRRVNGQPGCGKQLDSSAKRDTSTGGVWCRDCLVCALDWCWRQFIVTVDPNLSCFFPMSYDPLKFPQPTRPPREPGRLIRWPARARLIAFYLTTLVLRRSPANSQGCRVGLM